MNTLSSSLRKTPATVILILIGAAFHDGPARADDGSPADLSARAASVSKLTDEGFDLYRARDYRHANEKFLQAYTLDQDPNLLFNMARCHEAMGERESAIEKYETFVAKPDADAQGKRRATAAIRALRQAKTDDGMGARTTGNAESTDLKESAAGGGAVAGDRDEGGGSRRSLRAPVVLLGSGVLVAVVGAVAYAMGASDHGKVTGSAGYGRPGEVDALTEAQARQLVESGDTKKLVGGIALGLGGALLATSAVLFAIGTPHGRPARESGTVALGLGPGPAGGGQLLLRGRF